MKTFKALALAAALSVSIPGAAFAVTLADVANTIGQVDPAAALSAATAVRIEPLSGLDNAPEGMEELNAALSANPDEATALRAEVASNGTAAQALEEYGFTADDVVAIADAGGEVTLYVNDLVPGEQGQAGFRASPQPAIEDVPSGPAESLMDYDTND